MAAKRQYTLRLSREEKAQLATAARQQGISMAQVVRDALQWGFAQRRQSGPRQP